jgi:hypothetical protein
MDMANGRGNSTGSGQIVTLIVVAIVLAVGYVALDMYSAGQMDMLTVETRGLQMISALSRYKQETGSYPESLDKLVPAYTPTVSKCPNGESIRYAVAGGEFKLSCPKVVFKQKTYGYESRSRIWNG